MTYPKIKEAVNRLNESNLFKNAMVFTVSPDPWFAYAISIPASGFFVGFESLKEASLYVGGMEKLAQMIVEG